MSNFINENDKRFYAAASSGAAVESFPSQDFYRTMRHRELTAYRTVVQCMLMHNNSKNNGEESSVDDEVITPLAFNQLTRAQQRLLEDLESELLIPSTRRDAEIADANNDAAVTAVRTSGVANRRPLHFDGINDVPIENNDENDTDDDGAIIAVGQQQQKVSGNRRGRTGENGNGSTKPLAVSAKVSVPLDVATVKRLEKLKEEIKELCIELVQCFGPEDAGKKTRIEINLKKMRSEVEGIRAKAAKNCVYQG